MERNVKGEEIMETLKFWWLTMVEAPHFPSWEIFLFLTTALIVSALVRLHRLEKKVDEFHKSICELLDELEV